MWSTELQGVTFWKFIILVLITVGAINLAYIIKIFCHELIVAYASLTPVIENCNSL